MSLTEFLLARIAEDEDAARLGAGEPAYFHYGDTAAEESVEMARGEGCAKAGPDHLARWPPARVLAECEAKRRIIEQAEGLHNVAANGGHILRALALPYVDHPDYREEWRP